MADPVASSIEQRMMAIRAAAGSSGTWDWDILADRLYVDRHFADLYGLTFDDAREGVETRCFFTALHPEDRARIRVAVAGILGGAETFSKEFRIVTPDGATLWMHGRGQNIFDADDNPVRFTGLLVDVTDRKRTEERLRIAQTAGGVGTFEYSDGFATVAVSDEFCRLLGLHPTPVLPVQTVNGVLVAGEAPLISGGALPDAQVALDAEFRILRADDGAERWIARRGEVVREGSGYRLIGVIYDVTRSKEQEAQLRDLAETLEARVEAEVTERQQAQESLRQAQKMEAVGHLTGGIAHDFNNLLTIIIGNIDTVSRRLDASSDPRAKRSLDNALKGAERAAALTQRLLAFSRQQPLDPKAIDVARLLAGMSDLLTRSITEAVAIQIISASDLWRIEADPHQLENAILNLAVNARDAMGGSGALTVTARNVTISSGHAGGLSAGDYVAIEVADTGVGMSPETVAKVFEPFFTTKEVGKGTGLGLSMVYGFAQQSGGSVEITSVLGEGTTVRVFLPRALSELVELAETIEAQLPMGSASETILVVEDDDDVRAYTVGILRELGYRVIEAHDGATGLRLLERQDRSIELLLTDVIMPEMSGPELVAAATAFQPGLKVLFNSGYTRDAIMRDGRLEAGVDLLSKPFTFATLAAKVRELLDRAIDPVP
ncbi:PAS domain-containing protein [Sphingomonas sp. AP4-R1]|uniref:hybrid sensor histidine kinase/response regulator n=1 Tax=Sphingomonas sp. AP4-R1 TaxID=2735134 RepID=UPI001493BFE5|nr:hybrid sensor histidine kinase/response regulator [Sphingomonas sp. AP4-R1]QJU59371.1 PAS domain-containing protein [Sphingomonas sp. AP4-R1]